MVLKIRINSFSFLLGGIPKDETKHGGGFVYDCRFLENPGRIEHLKKFNGKDKEVIDFFEEKPEVSAFLDLAYKQLDLVIKKYQARKYEHLMVSFGCTGGQHRSVYCAEKLAAYLRKNYSAEVELMHTEEEHW